ncbi:MAG: enolase C-terminal domain-like protein [Pirellulaceae bacterium]|nr:enolase C-terminal domain-like protein [Pirellulaceae bacterium]
MTQLTTTRRRFIQSGLAAVAAGYTAFSRDAVALPPAHDLRVAKIDRVTVKVPYRPVPARNMARELPHWKYSEIFTVHLQSGHQGFGETLLYYTWGATGDRDVDRALGSNAVEIMWDDSLGAGLQMALFDAVARSADVPIHRLFGAQVHDRTPLSWWNIDTSAADMAAECKEAYRQGYMAYKTKGRPWFDIWKQLELSTREVPDDFRIDMDFNDTLLDAKRGLPILKDLEKHPQVDIYETPIPQSDIAGNVEIKNATRVNIAMHYGNPPAVEVIRSKCCDGFIIGGGATRMMSRGAVSAMADMPFWIQLVGTGITAAYSLHFGGALSHSTWPAVNCHQLYEHQLLKRPVKPEKGFVAVPKSAGLGFDIDWDAVERFRVDKPKSRPEPERLLEVSWPDGERLYIANTGRVNFVLDLGRRGEMPFYRRGADTRLVPNDGSDAWRKLYNQARQKPVSKKG